MTRARFLRDGIALHRPKLVSCSTLTAVFHILLGAITCTMLLSGRSKSVFCACVQ